MSDMSMSNQLSADLQQNDGHGKHRGQVSAQDSETVPHGRHRKPEPAETAA
ncbi:hypothetical protein ACIPSA_02475 [Streptomyces sp. NPDC086549]|uniref:hypothetical protein n=1 Tax=Streptomyces sp. NPDC086549 TaxID=3365752 RepID=UPI003804A1BA